MKMTSIKKIVPLIKPFKCPIPSQFQYFHIQYLYASYSSYKTIGKGEVFEHSVQTVI